eukprot:gnl/Dysnectes_brevis/4484_a6048_456.p1 GENE.gnl/Dysnectes_brevis/4484_a6048_456~~gnl/Dysnectes_brevis/4484_a6048_456.p1  ORF type:complete len:343 (+),score=60.65 gnl/Dysnectes_brevis/4484_a6048_456:133-1161(+)
MSSQTSTNTICICNLKFTEIYTSNSLIQQPIFLCDRCHLWYHFSCLGVPCDGDKIDKIEALDYYECPLCHLRTIRPHNTELLSPIISTPTLPSKTIDPQSIKIQRPKLLHPSRRRTASSVLSLIVGDSAIEETVIDALLHLEDLVSPAPSRKPTPAVGSAPASPSQVGGFEGPKQPAGAAAASSGGGAIAHADGQLQAVLTPVFKHKSAYLYHTGSGKKPVRITSRLVKFAALEAYHAQLVLSADLMQRERENMIQNDTESVQAIRHSVSTYESLCRQVTEKAITPLECLTEYIKVDQAHLQGELKLWMEVITKCGLLRPISWTYPSSSVQSGGGWSRPVPE